MKGNSAAAYVSYAFTEVAAIYPITPSSDMAEETDKMSADGVKNIFGQTVRVAEMQSGKQQARSRLPCGRRSPPLHRIPGSASYDSGTCIKSQASFCPMLHVRHAQSPATLSIFGDHSDVYACRQTATQCSAPAMFRKLWTWGSSSPATIKSRGSLLHFDGFPPQHEIQKIHVWVTMS